MTTSPTPLQLMDRLLDALKEAGIGWCQGHYAVDEGGEPVEVEAVCEVKPHRMDMEGALIWAVDSGALKFDEGRILYKALISAVPFLSGGRGAVTLATDELGWDFSRFREELAKREGEDAINK